MRRSLIVHPTDLGAESEGAFYHALKLALAGRSRLSVVHVHTYETEAAPDLDSYPRIRQTLTLWGLLPADAAQRDVSEKLGLFVSKGEILAAGAERGLAQMLRKQNAAMIVVGTRGLTGLCRLVDHSFSEQLSRDAKIPALFIPDDAAGIVEARTGAARPTNILIPVADEPDCGAAIQAAIGLSELLEQTSRLHLLHVGAAPKPHPSGST